MKQKTSSIIQIAITILLTAAFIFAASNFYFQNKKVNEEIKVEDQFVEMPEGEELKYFRDKLILAEAHGKFILEVDLNRQEMKKGEIKHYYSARLFENGSSQSTKTNFNSNSGEIKSNQFISNFENEIFDDLSTRETYSFSLKIDSKNIDVELEGLEGDFITRNTITYTRYLSAGTGNVKINGENFKVNAALEKVYSNDKSQYLFFPGINDLSSRTYRFLVWDTEGNFYLLDDSIVSKDNPHYRPHTWLLYKNASPKYMQKFFEADIDFQEKDEEKKWTIYLAGLKTTLILSTSESTEANWSNGTIKGTAQREDGNKELFGHFSYKRQ